MRPLALLLVFSTLVAAQDAPRAASPWLGSADVIAEYIRSATVQKLENIPVGVTKPQRAILAPGGPVASVVVKNLPPGRKGGFWESYLSEIAAYELDRMLELDMVPPTVEKRVDGSVMSAQMFVDRCVWLKELKGQQPPDVEAWNRQVHRHRVFDNLIANIDRNAGNLLVHRAPLDGDGRKPDWHLVLVDHSRCFTNTKKMQFQMTDRSPALRSAEGARQAHPRGATRAAAHRRRGCAARTPRCDRSPLRTACGRQGRGGRVHALTLNHADRDSMIQKRGSRALQYSRAGVPVARC